MDNFQGRGGDLTDIVRGAAIVEEQALQQLHNFQEFDDSMIGGSGFGDPFSRGRDPLLLCENCIGAGNEAISGNNLFFSSGADNNITTNDPSTCSIKLSGVQEAASTSSTDHHHHHHHHHQMKASLSSGILPISTASNSSCGGGGTCGSIAVPAPLPPPALAVAAAVASPRGASSGGDINVSACSSTNFNTGGQISSPRNPAMKRRKSQAKKVVCIPAPTAVNSRQGGGGEVVPSDLWAWRKYGQKPIKGSPYPRGYYRCSSSKGCSARKQVERSRTDPNMLVITYTSEHNHPWPTQRNSLAGSTRSHHPSKLTTTKSSSSTSSPHNLKTETIKEDRDYKEEANNNNSTMLTAGTANGAYPSSIDDQQEERINNNEEKQAEMVDDHQLNHEEYYDDHHAAVPQDDDQDFFFAELGDFLFSSEDNKDTKDSDPFTGLFDDWARGNGGKPSL
ncbi:WRKY Transcription Factor [Ancistrocladus abbreviatus]